MGRYIVENGKRVRKVGKERKPGRMEINIKGIGSMGRCKAMEK